MLFFFLMRLVNGSIAIEHSIAIDIAIEQAVC